MSKLYIYIMRSRNKDNTGVLLFKERCKTMVKYEDEEEFILKEFKNFAKDGVKGERSRLYKSVNARDEDKVRKGFIIKMFKDEPSITKTNRILSSVAQCTENRAESKWLFDFDNKDCSLLNSFLADVCCISNDDDIIDVCKDTPNGFAVVVKHGFDTRELMNKYKQYVTLKKDEMLFLDIMEA